MDLPSINLKVLSWNVENLFLLSDQELKADHLKLDEIQWQKLSTSIYPNKSLVKAGALGKIVLSENPDLIVLCEVGGLESLQNFNKLFLEDRYSAALVEGNSDRNIDVGFLIRKNPGFYFDIRTNKNRAINFLYPHERDLPNPVITSHKFSRDAAELHLFLQDHEHPFLIVVGTHLKSQLDRDRIDPAGAERRAAEFKTLLKITEELRAKWSPSVPILVAGDFNGNASRRQTNAEFAGLYDQEILKDVLEIAGTAPENCPTYYQIGRNGRSDGKQLDYAFLSPEAWPFLKKDSVRVYRYLDHLGFPLPTPTTLEAKGHLPSDHYPLVFELTGIPLR